MINGDSKRFASKLSKWSWSTRPTASPLSSSIKSFSEKQTIFSRAHLSRLACRSMNSSATMFINRQHLFEVQCLGDTREGQFQTRRVGFQRSQIMWLSVFAGNKRPHRAGKKPDPGVRKGLITLSNLFGNRLA